MTLPSAPVGPSLSRATRLLMGGAAVLLAAGALTLCFASVASAATFTVNSNIDEPDDNPGDGVCATAGQSPVCTLRAAIDEANNLTSDDRVVLPSSLSPYVLDETGA